MSVSLGGNTGTITLPSAPGDLGTLASVLQALLQATPNASGAKFLPNATVSVVGSAPSTAYAEFLLLFGPAVWQGAGERCHRKGLSENK
jgi:hypothetical protein